MTQNKMLPILEKVFLEIDSECEGAEKIRLKKEYLKLKDEFAKADPSLFSKGMDLENSIREFLTKIAKDKRACLAHQIRSDCWDIILRLCDESEAKRILLLNALSLMIENIDDSSLIENKNKFGEDFFKNYLKEHGII